jgi:hypothetical protein
MVEQASRRMAGRSVSNDLYMLTFIVSSTTELHAHLHWGSSGSLCDAISSGLFSVPHE